VSPKSSVESKLVTSNSQLVVGSGAADPFPI